MAQEAQDVSAGKDIRGLLALVGQNVNLLRHGKIPKLSQERLAEIAGVSVGSVQNLENARDPAVDAPFPQLDTLLKIASALDVRPGRLFDWPTPSYRGGRRKLHAVPSSSRGRKTMENLPLVVLAR